MVRMANIYTWSLNKKIHEFISLYQLKSSHASVILFPSKLVLIVQITRGTLDPLKMANRLPAIVVDNGTGFVHFISLFPMRVSSINAFACI